MVSAKAILFFVTAAMVVAFVLLYNVVSIKQYSIPGSNQIFFVARSPENQTRLADIYIKFFTGAIVSITAIVAVFTYVRNGRLERAKWISELHEKFFVEEKYVKMRRILDYKQPEADYIKLSESFPIHAENSNIDSEELLVNYLNFFEFIAVLKKQNQLSIGEINDTFGYYILQLKEHKWIVDSLRLYQFKNLPSLIEDTTRANISFWD